MWTSHVATSPPFPNSSRSWPTLLTASCMPPRSCAAIRTPTLRNALLLGSAARSELRPVSHTSLRPNSAGYRAMANPRYDDAPLERGAGSNDAALAGSHQDHRTTASSSLGTRTARLTGNRCLCRGCGQAFNSLSGFERHRVGDYGVDRRCLAPGDLSAKGWSRNAKGFWSRSAPHAGAEWRIGPQKDAPAPTQRVGGLVPGNAS